MSKTQPARGMRDFLPAEIRKRNYVIGIIKEVYESYGFEPLETPAVENIETLMGKYGEEGNQLIFKILKRGEKLDLNDKELADLALRYDLTVPTARVIANYRNELPKFFKRYQIQPVWRADRPARGRFREFYQCDVDAIGSSSMIVEAELCAAVSEILMRLGFDDFVIKLNHRKLLETLLAVSGIKQEKHIDALTAIDKLDKIGTEGVLKEFLERGIDEDATYKMLNTFLMLRDISKNSVEDFDEYNQDIIKFLDELIIGNNADRAGLDELQRLLQFTQMSSLRIRLDPSLARGLSYYTGAIFEIRVPDLPGSLGGGGRYDGLIGMFGKEQIPACGFSLGLERILVVMEDRGMFPPEIATNAADVMVTVWNEESIGESLRLAAELRKQDLRVLVYPETDKLGKQFKYAGQINAPFVCVLGDSELAENKVTLKNMQTGEQETVERDNIAVRLKDLINPSAAV